VHIVNLDPAAESFAYTPEVDVRELVTADDVMEMMDLGPNGALVYCMEYLLENLSWLEACIFLLFGGGGWMLGCLSAGSMMFCCWWDEPPAHLLPRSPARHPRSV
jgi:hypothetical protein